MTLFHDRNKDDLIVRLREEIEDLEKEVRFYLQREDMARALLAAASGLSGEGTDATKLLNGLIKRLNEIFGPIPNTNSLPN